MSDRAIPEPSSNEPQPDSTASEASTATPPTITEDMVFGYVQDHPKCTIPEINEGLNAPKGTVLPFVDSLKDAHRIKAVGNRNGYAIFVESGSPHDPGRAPRARFGTMEG